MTNPLNYGIIIIINEREVITMKKYEIRISGSAVKVEARSEKMALKKAKEIKGIPVDQPCCYLCRVIKK